MTCNLDKFASPMRPLPQIKKCDPQMQQLLLLLKVAFSTLSFYTDNRDVPRKRFRAFVKAKQGCNVRGRAFNKWTRGNAWFAPSPSLRRCTTGTILRNKPSQFFLVRGQPAFGEFRPAEPETLTWSSVKEAEQAQRGGPWISRRRATDRREHTDPGKPAQSTGAYGKKSLEILGKVEERAGHTDIDSPADHVSSSCDGVHDVTRQCGGRTATRCTS